MKLLLQMPGHAVVEWQSAFEAALPAAAISVWPEPGDAPDYVLVWKPPAELFARVPKARAIFNLGAGVDAVLAVPGLPEDVPLIRLEDAGMAEQMGEYVTHALLRAYREFDVYAMQQQAATWRQRQRLPKREFGVGLLGFGILAQAVAAAIAPLGFPLRAWSRQRRSAPGIETFAGDGELPTFLARSRVLVCLLPSTAQTRGLLDRAMLAHLPRGAHLINIARGDLLVDQDLLALLDEGRLAGATLDVFRTEPLPSGHPFWHHPRVVVTPHVSAATQVAESVAQVVAKIRLFESGRPVTGVVDRLLGY